MAAAVGITGFVWENCVVWLNWLAALGWLICGVEDELLLDWTNLDEKVEDEEEEWERLKEEVEDWVEELVVFVSEDALIEEDDAGELAINSEIAVIFKIEY